MTVSAPSNAPPWAHDLTRSIQREIEASSLFISLKPFTVAQLTAAMATQFPWKLAIVSDGAGNKHLAQSDSVIFRYMEGTAV